MSKTVKVPAFLQGLWLRVFDKNACLLPDADSTAVYFLRQIFCLGKKTEVPCTSSRIQKTMEEYHAIERRIRRPSLRWAEDNLDPHNHGTNLHLRDYLVPDLPLFPNAHCEWDGGERILIERCQRVADYVSRAFKFFEPVTYSGNRFEAGKRPGFRHGPGAVAKLPKTRYKYNFESWSTKLQEWFPYRDIGSIASDSRIPINHEVSSKLISVPKTAKSPRLIAAEPVEHQWCQQLMRTYFVEEIKRVFKRDFISFDSQRISQLMALRGSADGSLATIDLSSASDRLSCWVVERMFRKNPSILHALHSCRTRSVLDNISYEKGVFIQNKFAAQGTAVTFPVQTIVFFICALTIALGDRHPSRWRECVNQVRVFGDDIIVPNTGYDDMVTLLHALGLKVNEDKSFHRGSFRESCGGDFFRGHDVTPVKPKFAISDITAMRTALIDTSNNFFRKGCWHAARAVSSWAESAFFKHLPIGRIAGSSGLYSFIGSKVDHLKSRWNTAFQRTEYRTWLPISRVTKTSLGGLEAITQYFAELPDHDQKWSSGIASRPKLSNKLGWRPLYPYL